MKEIVHTDRGPKPIGPYSVVVKANGFLFLSGQTPLHPQTGLVAGTTIAEQTEQTLENIKAILESAGSNLQHVVKTTVFLKDMNNFAAMNEVYGRYFSTAPPARTTIEAARLPRDVTVEIEVIALA